MYYIPSAIVSCRSAHNLEALIKRMQAESLGGSGHGSSINATELAALLEKEVAEAKEAVWDHHMLIYGAFDYYSAEYSGTADEHAEHNVYSLNFSGYLAFARDAKFVCKFCPAGLLETIFTQVHELLLEVLLLLHLSHHHLSHHHLATSS